MHVLEIAARTDLLWQSYYASNIFVTLSLALSRCCVLIFVLRLTPIEAHRRVAYGIIIATALWAFGAVLSSALQCDPSQPWRLIGQSCDNVYTRLKAVCILDTIMEAAVVACTAFMIRPLKTPASKKFVVVFVFSFRLPIIIIVAFRLRAFNQNGLTTDFTFLETIYIALTQTQVNYSLISATIPNLRPIINNLNTHYGAMGESTLTGSNSNTGTRITAELRSSRRGSRRNGLGNVLAMSPLKRFKIKAKGSSAKGSSSGSRGEEWDEMPVLETVPSIGTQAVETGSSAHVSANRDAGNSDVPTMRDMDGSSAVSGESQRIFIRKDVDIHVQSDGR